MLQALDRLLMLLTLSEEIWRAMPAPLSITTGGIINTFITLITMVMQASLQNPDRYEGGDCQCSWLNNEGQYCIYPYILLQSIVCVCVCCIVHAHMCACMRVCVNECVCVHSCHWYTQLSQTILIIDYTTITHCWLFQSTMSGITNVSSLLWHSTAVCSILISHTLLTVPVYHHTDY